MLRPQLAESVPVAELNTYCEHDGWHMTQKVDGHRRMVMVQDGLVVPLNRSGQKTSLPKPVKAALEPVTGGLFAFDGELVGQVLWVFDLPIAGEKIDTSTPYWLRRQVLEGLFEVWHPGQAVRLLPRATSSEDKAALAKRVAENHGEGVMLNNLEGRYRPGVRSRDCLKVKYIHDVDCVVMELKRGGKDNIVIGLYRPDGRLVEVADCTALAGDGGMAQVGDVVVVQCLYATNDDRLYQPTKPRRRFDKPAADCTIDQLDTIRVNKEVLA